MRTTASLRGADMSAFLRQQVAAMQAARAAGVRDTANDTAKILRRQARAAFKGASPMAGDKRFAGTIRVKRMGKGWYRVYSRASYVAGRSMKVDLLWVFDTAPVVRGRNGKGVAIPLAFGRGRRNGQAPMAPNGRRFATPREATAMGWDLEFRPIKGGKGWLIVGRLAGGDHGQMYGSSQPYAPLYILWKQGVKMPKRFDLDGLMRSQGVKMDTFAMAAFDRRTM